MEVNIPWLPTNTYLKRLATYKVICPKNENYSLQNCINCIYSDNTEKRGDYLRINCQFQELKLVDPSLQAVITYKGE